MYQAFPNTVILHRHALFSKIGPHHSSSPPPPGKCEYSDTMESGLPWKSHRPLNNNRPVTLAYILIVLLVHTAATF